MAITLGDLRQFASESAAPDPASASADRKIARWINAAFERVHRAQDWPHFLSLTRVTLEPQVDVTAYTVAGGTGSVALTALAPAFASRYVTERWEFEAAVESRWNYRLSAVAVGGLSATLSAGFEWAGAAVAAGTGTLRRFAYPLPSDAQKILRAYSPGEQSEVAILQPDEFDTFRQALLRDTGPTQVCCSRSGDVEFWPVPGADRVPIDLTIKRAAPAYTTADLDATEVDWEEAKAALLRSAILLVASEELGEQAVVPYVVAKRSYDEVLGGCEAEVSGLVNTGGPIVPGARQGLWRPRRAPEAFRIDTDW